LAKMMVDGKIKEKDKVKVDAKGKEIILAVNSYKIKQLVRV